MKKLTTAQFIELMTGEIIGKPTFGIPIGTHRIVAFGNHKSNAFNRILFYDCYGDYDEMSASLNSFSDMVQATQWINQYVAKHWESQNIEQTADFTEILFAE